MARGLEASFHCYNINRPSDPTIFLRQINTLCRSINKCVRGYYKIHQTQHAKVIQSMTDR